MKIFISCSTSFYDKIPAIKEALENRGYSVVLPCSFDNPNAEEEAWEQGHEAHTKVVREFFRQSMEKIASADVLLCLNLDKEKNGETYKNYVGGAVFLELYEAFKNEKRIFLYNDIPQGILYDEISSFDVTIIHGNLDLIDLALNNKESSDNEIVALHPIPQRKPASFEVIPDSNMVPINNASYEKLTEQQANRSRGRSIAGNRRTGGSMSGY